VLNERRARSKNRLNAPLIRHSTAAGHLRQEYSNESDNQKPRAFTFLCLLYRQCEACERKKKEIENSKNHNKPEFCVHAISCKTRLSRVTCVWCRMRYLFTRTHPGSVRISASLSPSLEFNFKMKLDAVRRELALNPSRQLSRNLLSPQFSCSSFRFICAHRKMRPQPDRTSSSSSPTIWASTT
jgi:hypothetical protein